MLQISSLQYKRIDQGISLDSLGRGRDVETVVTNHPGDGAEVAMSTMGVASSRINGPIKSADQSEHDSVIADAPLRDFHSDPSQAADVVAGGGRILLSTTLPANEHGSQQQAAATVGSLPVKHHSELPSLNAAIFESRSSAAAPVATAEIDISSPEIHMSSPELDISSPWPCPGMALLTPPEPAPTLKQQTGEAEEEGEAEVLTCFVCADAAADAVLVECGHGGLCAGEEKSGEVRESLGSKREQWALDRGEGKGGNLKRCGREGGERRCLRRPGTRTLSAATLDG